MFIPSTHCSADKNWFYLLEEEKISPVSLRGTEEVEFPKVMFPHLDFLWFCYKRLVSA